MKEAEDANYCHVCSAEGSSNAIIRGVNNTYNERIKEILCGSNINFAPLDLGCPSKMLLSGNIPNLPIQISVSKLKEKMNDAKHRYKFIDVIHLPEYLSQPIAIFRSATTIDDTKVILTDMVCNGNNFVVALAEWETKSGQKINSVRSIYPKDSPTAIMSWIIDGLLIKYDKIKILDWFNKQQSNSADVIKPIKECTKIIEKMQ